MVVRKILRPVTMGQVARETSKSCVGTLCIISSEISVNRVCETVPAESRETCVVSVRVLTSVSTLGEVNLYDEEIVNLCDDSDCI